MNNIYEIGMEIEICENKLMFIKNDLKKELNKFEVNWETVHNLSVKSLDYCNKIKYNLYLKLKCIENYEEI